MTDEATTRRSHKRLWIGGIAGVVLLAAFVGLAWYLRSASFEDLVRRKLIIALEDATGGRVEMASFHWNLSQLAFEANDLTIHGLEPPGQMPYAHVDRALVRLQVISFFERRFSLERLELRRPVIHIIVNAEGSTNAPEPKVKSANGKSAVQELFDLRIAHANLRDGMIVINERRVPLDFSVNDVVAEMSFDARTRPHSYFGSIRIGKFDLQYWDFRDVPASADLQFTIWDNALQVQNLKLTSLGSSVQASGKLTDFNRPQVQLTYTSNLDVGQLGSVTRTPELRSGTLLLDGSVGYSQVASYSAHGHLAFRALDYLDEGLPLRQANLDANYAFAQDRLALSQISAHLLGGLVTGEAEIKNLVSLVPAPLTAELDTGTSKRRTKPEAAKARSIAGEQEGMARLRASGLSLNELMRTFSSRSLPLDKLNAAGAVTGAVNLEWKQSLTNAVADVGLDIAAPEHPGANQLPVRGNVRGRAGLHTERIDLAALNLAAPHTQVNATGSLGSATATLKLNADTTSLTEIQPLLSGDAPLPVELAGEASFSGTLSGRLRTPQVAGHLRITDFIYVYTPAASAAQPQLSQPPAHRNSFNLASAPQPPPAPPAAGHVRRIHVDAFSGDVQYSQTALAVHHAVIDEGSAQLRVDGSAALEKGNFTEDSPFQVQATLHNGDVAELQQAAGLAYPLQGKLNFAIRAAGTAENPHGQGQFSLAQAEVHWGEVKALSSQISFGDHAAQFTDIHLQAGHGTVTGSAAYEFRNRKGQLDLKGQSVDLADVPEVQTERLQVAGVANFIVKGSGTLERPLVNAHLEIASLMLNGDMLGKLTADAVTQGNQLTLLARSSFPKASFTLDANVDLDGEMPANAVLRFANLDIDPFLPARMRSQVTRQASLDGQAQLSGPLKQARLLHGTLNIQQFSVELQHIPVRSDGPVQLSFADEVLVVQRCTIASEDTHFVLTGTASLHGDHRLNLRASGALNLKLAQSLDPDVTSYGTANIDLSIGGTAAQPAMAGRVGVVHAGLSFANLPAGLGDVNGTLVFNQDRLELENVTARMGGGHVKLAGLITFGSTLGFNLTSDGTDIRFRYSGISVTSNQALRLTGTLQNASLTGNITVTRFAQIPSSDLQLLLSQASAPPGPPNPKSPLNNLHLEVRIQSTPQLTVETSLAKLSGDVDLRLRGTAARPVLLGRINIAEGDIKLAGTKYHLERGDITFVNPVRIDPVLDVEATTRVRDYDITIGLHGTLERLNATYRSDPPLSTDDIVSLLAFGKTQTEQAFGGASSPGFAESASGALLSSALNQVVTNRVSRIFGGSTIRINPSLGGPENDPNARLSLQQQVSNNITLTYITNLARSAQEVIQFEYNINSDYSLQGIRDENGVVSFDLLIRKRKR